MYKLKLKKNVRYSMCSCGKSKKLPYCDNMHRIFNKNENSNFKSIKILTEVDTNVSLSCKKWIKE